VNPATLTILFLTSVSASAEDLILSKWDGLTADAAVLYEGKPALFWPDIAKKTSIPCQNPPGNWTPYAAFSFRVHSEKATDSRLSLIITSENEKTEGPDYYSLTFSSNFEGWRKFVFARETLGAAREPLGWDKIGRVFFSSNWAHRLDPETRIRIADFRLSTIPIPGTGKTSGELLTNRSFEIDGNHDDTPDGWSKSSFRTEAKIQLDRKVAHTGKSSVRIEGRPKCRAGLSVGFRQSHTDPEHVYLLSAWVKVDGKSNHPQRTSARLTSVNAEGRVLKSDYRFCGAGPYGWRRHQWLAGLPAESVRFNLVLFHHGGGTAWWDDVSLLRARPVTALSPEQNSTVGDGKPTFRWQSDGKGELSVSTDSAFDPAKTQTFAVTGKTFSPPEPLALGKTYYWRVILKGEVGELPGITVSKGEDRGHRTSQFFAGTWKQRSAPLREKVEKLEARLAPLNDFAQRNRMWDSFSLLAGAVKRADAFASTEPDNPAEAIQNLDEAWKELGYTLPWWEKIFLDDRSLFAGLDLERPGLEKVKGKASAGDYAAARLALLKYYKARKKPSWYSRFEEPLSRRPGNRIHRTADQYLTHRMPIHSYKEPVYDLGGDFDWHIFPTIDVEWPTKIHRHFHWRTIAGAYWQTGNEKYGEEIKQQLFDWAKDNPMERWDRFRYRWAWSTLNATVRIYSSWINAWLQVRHSDAWNEDAQFVFLTELREHGRFLMTHAARTGNWVVAEARGLVELGVLFPEFKEAKAWREEGFRRLKRELQKQVLEDGVHVERTPGYHSMTMSCFMDPVRLGHLNQVEGAGIDEFISKIEKMHELYLYGSKPNRRMAQIGDAGPMSADRFLRRGYEMFRRDDMRYVVSDGKEGRPPVHRSYAFDAAGFYVSRSAWCDRNALWSIIDWGGYLGHCHDDMGHISLYAYGSDLLIDSGRYSYAWPMRAPFHQTIGHNTVMVDRKTQKRRDPLEAQWISTGQFDYFRGLTDNSEPLRHERTLIFRQPGPTGPGYWLCMDRLTGKGRHRLDQRWHPFEDLKGEVAGSSVILSPKEGQKDLPSLVIANQSQKGMKTEIVPGAVSYAWYKKIPVDVAQFTFEKEMPATFLTVLYPTPPDFAPAKVSITRGTKEGDITSVIVAIEDRGRKFNDQWHINHAGNNVFSAEAIETDARVVCLRKENGRLTSWFLVQGRRLLHEDKLLFQAASTVEGAGAEFTEKETATVCTDAKDVSFMAAGTMVLNGRQIEVTPEGGVIHLSSARAPAPSPVPRAEGEIKFEIEPPPPPMLASTVLKMLPAAEKPPQLDVKVEAESFTGQGGGSVTIAATKVGTSKKAFLHWDNAGHWLEWSFDIPKAGQRQLLIHACTAEYRALRKLTVNGKTPPGMEAMELTGTGGYSNDRDDWRTFMLVDAAGKPVALGLQKGKTVIRLENVDSNSLNLDWLGLTLDK